MTLGKGQYPWEGFYFCERFDKEEGMKATLLKRREKSLVTDDFIKCGGSTMGPLTLFVLHLFSFRVVLDYFHSILSVLTIDAFKRQ